MHGRVKDALLLGGMAAVLAGVSLWWHPGAALVVAGVAAIAGAVLWHWGEGGER